jgi:predicted dehydrogenase
MEIMDILVIGVSSIFCRRVLPALLSLECVGKIHLASSRTSVEVDIPESRRGKFLHGYETALRDTPPCIAYISLPNHLHAEWTRKALMAGFHVIVDKPAFLDWQETQFMLQLAMQNNLCLAESTVWPFHPQVQAVRSAFDRIGSEPRSIQAVFSFPPLPQSNFRNDPKMGGGSFYDLGRYAVTPGRIFFKDDPIHVSADILSRNEETGIDTGFTFSAIYPRGRLFQGFFSFDTEYKNSLSILGKGLSVTLEPAFTFTNAMIAEVSIRTGSQSERLTFEPADSFAVFFQAVISSIQAGEWSSWLEVLGRDAHVLHLAAEAVKERKL